MKLLNKLGKEVKFLNMMKYVYENLQKTINESLRGFPVIFGMKQECSLLPILCNTVLEVQEMKSVAEKIFIAESKKQSCIRSELVYCALSTLGKSQNINRSLSKK